MRDTDVRVKFLTGHFIQKCRQWLSAKTVWYMMNGADAIQDYHTREPNAGTHGSLCTKLRQLPVLPSSEELQTKPEAVKSQLKFK